MTLQIETTQIYTENHVIMCPELVEIPITDANKVRAQLFIQFTDQECNYYLVKIMKKKNIPLLPTPWAPHTAILTSDNEDFFRRMPRVVIIVH